MPVLHFTISYRISLIGDESSKEQIPTTLTPTDGLISFIPQTLFYKLFKHRIRFA